MLHLCHHKVVIIQTLMSLLIWMVMVLDVGLGLDSRVTEMSRMKELNAYL